MTISTCAVTASPRQPDGPGGWTLYVSHYDGHVKRLVVFVHGFHDICFRA
jgi:hypothetical protein